MLTETQVERYSRQIILPEVGGRGQARLLAARVTLVGDGTAAATAATLLARAGIAVLDLVDGPTDLRVSSPDCRILRTAAPTDADVFVDLTGDPARAAVLGRTAQVSGRAFVVGRQHGTWATLALLVGRPCSTCLPAEALAPGARSGPPVLEGPAALAFGALAASEALRALLVPPRTGRRHSLDFASGRLEAAPLAATGRCAVCGEAA